jgi:hypothetical protein
VVADSLQWERESHPFVCVWKEKRTLFNKINESADFDLSTLRGQNPDGGRKKKGLISSSCAYINL